ncbi:IS1249 family transposase [Arthrobacter sp. NtRootA1]|uniref:IS1249 family transposase n=1 Tax=Micrococcaceae TaxID=1268 RepID=UPI001CC751E0|nr:IS1249 family transposase [Arthrobacter sp. NtRootA1]
MVCGQTLVRNGKTAAGKQRYRCLNCGASRSGQRPDVSRRAELEAFLGWLLGTSGQSSLTMFGTARSFRRRTAWCWNIAPRIPVTGEVHDQIQVDGIFVGSWCCLIAVAGDYVLGWQWCDTEKKAAWAALLQRFPAPRVVITDGGSGIAAALSECWSETAVQRCLVHVQRNVRTYLTSRPRTDAGKALLRLGRALTRIKAPAEAAAWLAGLNDWHQEHGHLVKARTYRTATAMAPGWVRANQTWWYTHDRLRKAYRLLERLGQAGTLFTYLQAEYTGLDIASTTNRIEGGTNAQLRLILRAHRGMSEDHQKRAIEWYLYLHSDQPRPPAKLIENRHYKPGRTNASTTTEPEPGPEIYSTGLSPDEGLWHRAGWAGRS